MWKLFLIILVSVITTSEGLCCNYGTSASSAGEIVFGAQNLEILKLKFGSA